MVRLKIFRFQLSFQAAFEAADAQAAAVTI
jgi:hypothetical protein